MRRAAFLSGVALAAVLVTATPAGAHAELRSSVPANGATLQDAPRQIVLRFSQDVEITFGAVRVFDAQAGRVDDGRATHPDGDGKAVLVALPRLADGSYVVTWRVVSADGHPARGAFTFQVGAGGAGDGGALARRLLAAGGGSEAAGAVYAAVRLLAFGSLAVFAGGLWFLLAVWPAGGRTARARRIVLSAGAVALAATVAGVGLQGVTAGGLPLGDAVDPSVVDAVLGTRFGRLSALRAVLLVACLALLATRPARPLRVPLALLGLAVLSTVSASGHAVSGRLVPFAVVADVVHLAAISLWLGGLVMVVSSVLREDVQDAASVVRRFSRLAFWAVAAIVVSGAFQGWRQVGGLEPLTSTTYGRLLSAKVALFAVLLGLAWVSRRAVNRRWPVPVPAPAGVASAVLPAGPGARRADPDAEVRARLRRSVGAEVVLAVAVLAVAALLVNVVPARTAFARPYSVDVDAGHLVISVTVDPARSGPADLHLYTLGPSGQVSEVESMSARLGMPALDIPPLTVPLRRAGPGHFVAYGFNVPVAGSWELELVAWLTTTDFVEAKTTVLVR